MNVQELKDWIREELRYAERQTHSYEGKDEVLPQYWSGLGIGLSLVLHKIETMEREKPKPCIHKVAADWANQVTVEDGNQFCYEGDYE